ncbi:MAG: hypothetical protein ABIG92_03265 [Candidatus Omnitrophota bacterium]
MSYKKITRKDFMKTGILGIIAFIIAPIVKTFSAKKDSYKDARHYKNLAG